MPPLIKNDIKLMATTTLNIKEDGISDAKSALSDHTHAVVEITSMPGNFTSKHPNYGFKTNSFSHGVSSDLIAHPFGQLSNLELNTRSSLYSTTQVLYPGDSSVRI